MRNFTLLFFLLIGIFSVKAQTQAPTVTYGKLTNTDRVITEPLHITLTNATNPLENSTVDLCNDDAYLYFINMRPNAVYESYQKKILINGESLKPDVNCRLVVYRQGTAVIPHSPSYQPLEIFTEKKYKGESSKYEPHTFHSELGDMNRRMRSFHLKKGYMATFATASDCSDYSRVFIADKEDLWVESLPDILDQGVAFIRVMPWSWPSKKGWCQTGSAAIKGGNQMECTWFYNWDAQSTRDYNMEYVPEKWSTSWPSFSTIKSQKNVSHLIGYNEPDHTEQSDVSVDAAVAQWPELMKTGLRLGAPATTDFSWLYDFMNKCKANNYRVDYVVIHAYWESLTPQQWYSKLKEVHDKTGCAIWIKEWNNGANWTNEWWPDGWAEAYAKQKSELTEILNVMDTAHFVERYSIYNWVGWKRMVIDDSGKNTPAGDLYRDNKPTFAYNKTNEVVPTWSNKSITINETVLSGDSAVSVSWNNRNGGLVDEFIVLRNDNGTGFKEVARLPRYMESYIDVEGTSVPGYSTYKIQSVMRTGSTLSTGEVTAYKSSGYQGVQYLNYALKDSDPKNVTFLSKFEEAPGVILGVKSYNNGQSLPLTSKVKEITSTGVTYCLEPWEYLNKTVFTKSEDLPLLALEKGAYDFGGLKAECGDASYLNANWSTVKFKTPFDEVPAVFATVNSNKTSAPVSVVIRNVTTEGFEIALKKELGTSSSVTRQNISYLAITPGVGRIGKNVINVGITDNNIGSVSNTQMILFNSAFVNPYIFANTQTYSDEITSTLRYGSLSSSQVKIFRHREASSSSDVSDMQKESVAWMVLETDDMAIVNSVEKTEKPGISVSPTVVTDFVSVRGLDESKINTVTVYDSFGRILMSSVLSGDNIDLSSLTTGVYYLKVNNSETVMLFKK